MKRNKNTKPPVIKVTPTTPGKVTTKYITINLKAPAKKKDTEIKAKDKSTRTVIQKDSAQKVKSFVAVKFRAPYADPEFVRLCYEGNAEHYRCLKFTANCIIGAGFNIEPLDPKLQDYKTDKEYKKCEDFLTKPVNDMNEYAVDVCKAAVEDKRNFGIGLIEAVKNDKGELAELYYFSAYEARLVYEDNTKGGMFDKLSVIQLINLQEAGRFKLYNEKNFKDKSNDRCVVLLRNINPFDKFYGFPEWYPATPKLTLTSFIDEYNIKAFKNDLMLSFVIIVEGGELASGQEVAIKKFLQANHTGVQNAARSLILCTDHPEIKIKIEKVQKDGRETSFMETLSKNTDSIVISHGVVGSLLGISKPGKLGNTNENYDLFQVMNETVIKPEQTSFANILNSLIRVGLGVTKFKLVPKELTFEKLSEMVKFATELKREDIIDGNEARQYVGYEIRDDNPSTLLDKTNQLQKEVRILKKALIKSEL